MDNFIMWIVDCWGRIKDIFTFYYIEDGMTSEQAMEAMDHNNFRTLVCLIIGVIGLLLLTFIYTGIKKIIKKHSSWTDLYFGRDGSMYTNLIRSLKKHKIRYRASFRNHDTRQRRLIDSEKLWRDTFNDALDLYRIEVKKRHLEKAQNVLTSLRKALDDSKRHRRFGD